MNKLQTSNLSLEEKIGQLFFVGIPGPVVDTETVDLLIRIKPGGVCLFARNIKEPRQTRELLDTLRSMLPILPFLSLDQEGGLVDRLRRIMNPAPAAARFNDPDDVREFAEITAEALRILGFNMDFAPVVDVITEARNDAGNGMYSRGFGKNREETTAFAGTFLDTLQANGITGCLKHFPGLGAARTDSHEELPQIDLTDEVLRKTDLYPYEVLFARKVDFVMIAHAAYPNSNLQQNDQHGRLLPSSLSFKFATKLLRDDLKFKGIAITDDLEMGAIVNNYGMGDACKLALKAGNDMLAICAKPDLIVQGHAAITDAVNSGEIGLVDIDRAVERIFALKRRIAHPLRFDADRLGGLSQQMANLNSRLN